MKLLLWRDAVDPDWYALGYVRKAWSAGTTGKLLDLHIDQLNDLFGSDVHFWAKAQTAWPIEVTVTLEPPA